MDTIIFRKNQAKNSCVPLLPCLGISPPNLKGRESKEAHEPGQMQDLKPKNIKKKLKKIPKTIPKTFQNGGPNLSKILLGGLLGPLGALLGPLGRLLGPLGALLGRLGPVLGPLGCLLEPLGASWEPLGALLGLSWCLLGSS